MDLNWFRAKESYSDIAHGKPKQVYGVKFVSTDDGDELSNVELSISMKKVKNGYEVISFIQ